MDLPTYTNIWRIEKRLYKLYDFRLPAPLPITWIAVFAGITVPYIFFLVVIGLPFNHNLVWLYVLPPGVLTWLTTRPVIENKRLPELVSSQVRYLSEPKTWCRMTPFAEKDDVVVTVRVWHRRPPGARPKKAKQARKAATRATAAEPTLEPAAARTSEPLVSPSPASAAPLAPQRAAARAADKRVRTPRARQRGPELDRRATAPASEPRPAVVRRRPPWAVPPAERRQDSRALEVSHDPEPDPRDLSEPGHAPATSASWPEVGAGAFPQVAAFPQVGPFPAVGAFPEVSPFPEVGAFPEVGPFPEPSAEPEAFPETGPAAEAEAEAGPAAEAEPETRAEAEPDTEPAARATLEPDAAPEASAPSEAPPEEALEALPEAALETLPEAVPEELPEAIPEPTFEAAPEAAPRAAEVPAADALHLFPGPSAVPEPDAMLELEPLPEPEPAPAARRGLRVFQRPAPEPEPAADEPAAPGRSMAAKVAALFVDVERDRPLPSVERALSSPGSLGDPSWRRRVKVVAGGQRPGQRDQEALDRERARMPLPGPRRIAVLGCTSGAGQSVIALMTGHTLAAVRQVPVAVLDLNPGEGSLAARIAPVTSVTALLAGRGPDPVPGAAQTQARDRAWPGRGRGRGQLDVIAGDGTRALGPEAYQRLAGLLADRYPLTMIDPAPGGLTRVLELADQLVLVTPANREAATALAHTQQWLSAHGYDELAARAVTVINGVSPRSTQDVLEAESVARGRCRAIVRVPWDDVLSAGAESPAALHPQTRLACTALAGVLVAGLNPTASRGPGAQRVAERATTAGPRTPVPGRSAGEHAD